VQKVWEQLTAEDMEATIDTLRIITRMIEKGHLPEYKAIIYPQMRLILGIVIGLHEGKTHCYYDGEKSTMTHMNKDTWQMMLDRKDAEIARLKDHIVQIQRHECPGGFTTITFNTRELKLCRACAVQLVEVCQSLAQVLEREGNDTDQPNT
jgi:hypothetical protein